MEKLNGRSEVYVGRAAFYTAARAVVSARESVMRYSVRLMDGARFMLLDIKTDKVLIKKRKRREIHA